MQITQIQHLNLPACFRQITNFLPWVETQTQLHGLAAGIQWLRITLASMDEVWMFGGLWWSPILWEQWWSSRVGSLLAVLWFAVVCGLPRALGRLLLTAMGRGWDWGQSIGFTGLNAHPPLHTINTVLILINSAPLMVMQPLYAFLRMTRWPPASK